MASLHAGVILMLINHFHKAVEVIKIKVRHEWEQLLLNCPTPGTICCDHDRTAHRIKIAGEEAVNSGKTDFGIRQTGLQPTLPWLTQTTGTLLNLSEPPFPFLSDRHENWTRYYKWVLNKCLLLALHLYSPHQAVSSFQTHLQVT